MSEHEKEAAGEIVVKSRFLKWLDNFWYHYKWYVIIIGFFVLVFAVCFSQCVQREEIDIPVVFGGAYVGTDDAQDYRWTEEKRDSMEEIFESLLEKNGVVGHSVGFVTYDILNEEQMRDKATETETTESETGEFSNSYFNMLKQNNLSEIESLVNYMGTGECSVWFVSEFLYKEQKMEKRAMPLSEIFGEEIPESAYGEYAIRLGDTELYRYYDAMKMMPEDTLIVLTRGWVVGSSSDAKIYSDYMTLYRAIALFEAP